MRKATNMTKLIKAQNKYTKNDLISFVRFAVAQKEDLYKANWEDLIIRWEILNKIK